MTKIKRVIITGTSRGIGLELVKRFAEQGHQVLALSRNSEIVTGLNYENVTAFSFDISWESSFDKVKDFLMAEWDSIDVLINNAGNLVNKPFIDLSMEDFQQVYNVNVFGVARLIQTTLPFLIKGSHVVTVSSMGGIQGSLKFPGLAAYSSSKGAVITMSELLAEEYKEQGIAFNALALGAVQTEMLAEAFPGYQAPLTSAQMANYIYDFALTGNTYYNGKILQVSSSTP